MFINRWSVVSIHSLRLLFVVIYYFFVCLCFPGCFLTLSDVFYFCIFILYCSLSNGCCLKTLFMSLVFFFLLFSFRWSMPSLSPGSLICAFCQLLSRQCRSCVAISSYIWLLGLWRLCLLPTWLSSSLSSDWLTAHTTALTGCTSRAPAYHSLFSLLPRAYYYYDYCCYCCYYYYYCCCC